MHIHGRSLGHRKLLHMMITARADAPEIVLATPLTIVGDPATLVIGSASVSRAASAHGLTRLKADTRKVRGNRGHELLHHIRSPRLG